MGTGPQLSVARRREGGKWGKPGTYGNPLSDVTRLPCGKQTMEWNCSVLIGWRARRPDSTQVVCQPAASRRQSRMRTAKQQRRQKTVLDTN